MNVAQYIAVAAALLLCVWPMLPVIAGQMLDVAPSYRQSILNLAQVRARLRATDSLGEDQKRAIDVLTLALVDGSDA